MVASGWIFINKTMNVIAIKLTKIACNSFSRSCLVGGHLLFFEFHTVEYIQRLCVKQPMWHDHKVEATKGYQRFDWFTDTSFYWESDLYIDTLLVIMKMK